MATEILIKGNPSRVLPSPQSDNQREGVPAWLDRYAAIRTAPGVRKQHAMADEGSYFLVNNGQAGILSSPATGFVATTPACVIVNSDAPTNQAAKRIYLDYVDIVTTVVGSAASGLVNLQLAIVIDNGNRYSSGGTQLTPFCPNMDLTPKSIALVYFGAITALAATASARNAVGLRIPRNAVSATVLDVVGEEKHINFGGVEASQAGNVTIANANQIPIPAPPIVIGPNQSALVYIWQNLGATNVAATYAPEVAWWER